MAHGNKLSSINLAENRKRLQALNLEQNNFTFATLPRLADLRVGAFYRYGGQQPVEVECVNGEVDLSAQASVSDIPTEFRWYLGQPEQDPDTGELSGEELWGGWPDPEYTVSNGVVKVGLRYGSTALASANLENAEARAMSSATTTRTTRCSTWIRLCLTSSRTPTLP